MCYKLLRKILFSFNPETAHHIALTALDYAPTFLFANTVNKPCEVMGLQFNNRVGLAAGLDKNAAHIKGLAKIGFGFIEVGTVTPKPQPGNPRPRLFRLIEDEALINRLGFNNAGLETFINNVKRRAFKGILGINIGKNAITPNEKALDDYLTGLRAVYPYANYITINISSPNTKDLRHLQQANELSNLLQGLKTEQQQLAQHYQRYVPLVIKIAPDLEDKQIIEIATILLDFAVDGVIATNTTIQRPSLKAIQYVHEQGGLSGKPLFNLSTQVVEKLAAHLQGRIPIIAAGGIMSADDAQTKINAGASLVQIYTGFIYYGPALVKAIGESL